jgi:hypothetical protein
VSNFDPRKSDEAEKEGEKKVKGRRHKSKVNKLEQPLGRREKERREAKNNENEENLNKHFASDERRN